MPHNELDNQNVILKKTALLYLSQLYLTLHTQTARDLLHSSEPIIPLTPVITIFFIKIFSRTILLFFIITFQNPFLKKCCEM